MARPLPLTTEARPLCSVCKRRPATNLCDFPLRHIRYIGHPPRHLMQQAKNSDVAFKEVKMSWTMTCDKPLCDQCAIAMNNDIHFCPTHIQEMQTRQKLK